MKFDSLFRISGYPVLHMRMPTIIETAEIVLVTEKRGGMWEFRHPTQEGRLREEDKA